MKSLSILLICLFAFSFSFAGQPYLIVEKAENGYAVMLHIDEIENVSTIAVESNVNGEVEFIVFENNDLEALNDYVAHIHSLDTNNPNASYKITVIDNKGTSSEYPVVNVSLNNYIDFAKN